VHEMMDSQLWKQRREELLREAELSRRAKALRATHKRRAGRRSAQAWEIKRQAQRLLKFHRKTLRKEPERRRKDDASSSPSKGTSNGKEKEGSL
jgi:hypothetical protein